MFYFRHIHVGCQTCNVVLSERTISGNKPGMGSFKGQCSICSLWYDYDCAECSASMLNLNDALPGLNMSELIPHDGFVPQ